METHHPDGTVDVERKVQHVPRKKLKEIKKRAKERRRQEKEEAAQLDDGGSFNGELNDSKSTLDGSHFSDGKLRGEEVNNRRRTKPSRRMIRYQSKKEVLDLDDESNDRKAQDDDDDARKEEGKRHKKIEV